MVDEKAHLRCGWGAAFERGGGGTKAESQRILAAAKQVRFKLLEEEPEILFQRPTVQHSKDRAYITKTEWATEWGGFKNKDVNAPFRQLPFFCCALTFVCVFFFNFTSLVFVRNPFEDPVATDDGMVFEITHIIPYLQKFKTHPVTGNPLKISDLTKLNFTKNAESSFCCPVLGKVFTASTHIVAIKTSGNVYCYQAIEEMCIKAKFWRDLVTDEKFTRKDIITIQDPMNVAAREVTKFDHLVKDKSVRSSVQPLGPWNPLRAWAPLGF
eukprot:gene1306-1893_t